MNRNQARARLLVATAVLALLAISATAPTAAVETSTPAGEASACVDRAEAIALFEQVEAFAAGELDPVEAQRLFEATDEVAERCGERQATTCSPSEEGDR